MFEVIVGSYFDVVQEPELILSIRSISFKAFTFYQLEPKECYWENTDEARQSSEKTHQAEAFLLELDFWKII